MSSDLMTKHPGWAYAECGTHIPYDEQHFDGDDGLKRCFPPCSGGEIVEAPDNSHYTKGSIEPWSYIAANNLNFFEGSVVKYITRWRHKNGLEDLLKAEVYIKELIRQERENEKRS